MQDLLSKNPDVLCVRVFPEADGEFELYEDDNESCGYVDGRCVTTAMKYSADKDMFVISPADGDTSLIPDNRIYKLVFERRTEAAADKVKVSVMVKRYWQRINMMKKTESSSLL